MKLRILSDSLRIRVTQTELNTVADHGEASAAIRFGGGTALHYVLRAEDAIEDIEATYADNIVTVRLPLAAVREWATTTMVSLRGEQTLDEGSTLKILVEKDFACLEPREGEDESDMFPHPEGASKNC